MGRRLILLPSDMIYGAVRSPEWGLQMEGLMQYILQGNLFSDLLKSSGSISYWVPRTSRAEMQLFQRVEGCDSRLFDGVSLLEARVQPRPAR